MSAFKVGVFPHQGKTKMRYMAYTTWYNPAWEGCCEHVVNADTGNAAKKIAIQEHKANCIKADPNESPRP